MSVDSPEARQVTECTEAHYEQACDDAAGNSDFKIAHAIGLRALLESDQQASQDTEKSYTQSLNSLILEFAEENGIGTDIRAALRMQGNYQMRIEAAGSEQEKRELQDHLAKIERNNPELIAAANAVRRHYVESRRIN